MKVLHQKPWGALYLGCCAALCVAVCSCKKESLLPNEKRGTGDLSTVVFSQIARYGGVSVPLNLITNVAITNFSYTTDRDGFQVVCQGNEIERLCSMFRSCYGQPAISTTNTIGLASFVYAIRQAGVAVNCGLDKRTANGATQEVTHLVVVRAGAFK
jgi:hypothetical protein